MLQSQAKSPPVGPPTAYDGICFRGKPRFHRNPPPKGKPKHAALDIAKELRHLPDLFFAFFFLGLGRPVNIGWIFFSSICTLLIVGGFCGERLGPGRDTPPRTKKRYYFLFKNRRCPRFGAPPTQPGLKAINVGWRAFFLRVFLDRQNQNSKRAPIGQQFGPMNRIDVRIGFFDRTMRTHNNINIYASIPKGPVLQPPPQI